MRLNSKQATQNPGVIPKGGEETFHSKAICKEHTFAADDFLTVYSVEGVGLFFVGSLWSADDLQHRAL